MNDNKSITAPLISIIVPVYNVEKYVEECMRSILTQSYKNWEMILINDGSTDKSLEICKKICKNEKRVIIISQTNKGLPAARNTGIKAACGEYLLFVDSDDYLPQGALKTFNDCIESNHYPDFIKGNHLVHTPDGKIINTKFEKIREPFYNIPLTSNKFFSDVVLPHPMAWNSLIRRKVIADNKILFADETWPREDLIFNLSLSMYTFNCIYINTPTYIYRLAIGGSLSNSQSILHTKNYSKIAMELQQFKQNVTSTPLKNIIDKEYNNTVQSILINLLRINSTDARNIWHQFNSDITYCKINPTGSLMKRFIVWTYNVSPRLYLSLASLIRPLIPKSKKIY